MTSQRLAAAFTTFRDAPTPLLPEPCTPGCLGWDIFDSLDGTGLHIERCDECSTIPGDEEAGHIATFDLAHGTGIPSSARRDIATALENQSAWISRPALCDECYSEQEIGCLGGIYCPECHKAGAAFRRHHFPKGQPQPTVKDATTMTCDQCDTETYDQHRCDECHTAYVCGEE